MTQKITPNDYTDFVMGLFARAPGDLSKDFAHACLGIITEIGELADAPDVTNAVEEGGDLLFYYTAAAAVLHEQLLAQGIFTVVHPTTWTALAGKPAEVPGDDAVFKILDASKRWVGYGKVPPDIHALLAMLAATCFDGMESIQEHWLPNIGFDEFIQQCADRNVAKLRVRYKTGRFSAEQALNRDLDAERAALTQ